MRSNRFVASLVCAATFAAVACSPLSARATEEDAKAFFAEGRKLRLEGKCEQAIVQFRRAMDIYPEGIGALRNIAECEEQLGLYASARVDYWSLRRAAMQSTEAKYAGWDKEAEAGYNRLANKVAKVTIALRGEALDRVRVKIDGKPLDPRLTGVEIERDLGPHTFEASYGGATSLAQKRTLVEGAHETITFEVPSLKDTQAQLAANPQKGAPDTIERTVYVPVGSSEDEIGKRRARFIGGTILGVGVLSGIGAIVSGVVRSGALNDINNGCASHTNCAASLKSDDSTGKTTSILVDVFGGVAIAGVALGGGIMIYGFTGSGAQPAQKTGSSATLSFVPLQGGGGANAMVRF